MGILIAYLLGILTAVKPKQQNRKSFDQYADYPQYQYAANGPIPVVCVPPPKTSKEERKEKKKERRETIKFWVEVIGAFLVAAYLLFTILIWRANKKSAEAAQGANENAQRTS